MGAERVPNLFIVGAPKCGTTAWVEYLRTHPDIFFPVEKEHCYFALDLPNFRLTKTRAGYEKLFANRGNARVVGEASAMYLFSSSAADAICNHNPRSKILIFLREQEDYLPSLHNQFLWEFAEEIEDFETVWRFSGQRPADSIPTACLEPSTLDYAAMGRFREQVERYLAAFPPEQVRVIWFREWVANPRAMYCEILEFLGVEDDGRSDFSPINQGMTYRSRKLVRLIIVPPAFLRRAAHLVRALTGPVGELLERVVRKGVRMLSAPGYKRQDSPELRNEIRQYYFEDNRLLEERLRSLSARITDRRAEMASTRRLG